MQDNLRSAGLAAALGIVAVVALVARSAFSPFQYSTPWEALSLVPKFGVLALLGSGVLAALGIARAVRSGAGCAPEYALARAADCVGLLVVGAGLLQFGWYGMFDGIDCAGNGCMDAFHRGRHTIVTFLPLCAIPFAGAAVWFRLARTALRASREVR